MARNGARDLLIFGALLVTALLTLAALNRNEGDWCEQTAICGHHRDDIEKLYDKLSQKP